MSTKITISLIFLLLIPTIGYSQGEEHGIEIVLTSQRLIEVEPGNIITGSYLITNRTGHELELIEKLELPVMLEGWQPLMAYERPVLLGIGRQKVQLVTFLIPKDCPDGKYEITYSLVDRRYQEVKGVEKFTVVVKPIVKFDAIIEDQPEIVMAGDTYNVRLRLVNTGNSTTPMRLEAKGSPDLPFSLDLVETTLAAGKSQLVNLSVSTDRNLKNKTNHVVEISAIAETPDNTLVMAKRTVFVEILPKLMAAVDLRSKVPTRMRLIAAGEDDVGGMQIEYSGAGNLDESGAHSIDFMLRGPDIKDRSIYGSRDVLRLNYRGPWLNILLGDQAYSLSPLSERLIYGRGGEISIHPKGFELGSFFMETRWETPERREVSAFAGYHHEDKFAIRANYLNKRKDPTLALGKYEADIYSAQARISPSPVFNLGFEYGYCMDSNNKNKEDYAHRITFDGEMSKRVWYTFENTYAGPKYLGYYNDVLYSSGTVAATIIRKLRGNFSYRIYENNLELDPSKTLATREQSFRGVLSYAFSSGMNISLDYETLERMDDLTPSQFDFNENIWRLGLGHSFSKFGFQVYSERGSFEDQQTDEPMRTLYRHNIYAHFHPTPRQSYSLIARIGHNSFLGDPEKTASIGLSTSLQLRHSLRLGLNFQANNIDAERLPRQSYLLSTLDYTLPNRHSLSLKMRWFKFEKADRSDYSFFAAYTIPFDIPAMKKKSFGALKGHVLDRDRIGTPPMENVLISVGNMATMTDHTGEFHFPVLQPGMYSVQLDQRSMGMNRITADISPLEVEVIGGETAFQEIGVSTVAVLSGKVIMYAIDPARIRGDRSRIAPQGKLYITGHGEIKQGAIDRDDLIESYGLEDIIVEISRDGEIYRQATTQNGNFSFPGLRPGIWRIKVYENGIPKHHYIENPEFAVELLKGEERSIAVSVIPKLRSIEILEGGMLDEGD